jgi:multidrug efflux pump subunit AcrA (membrane-fusion protein)
MKQRLEGSVNAEDSLQQQVEAQQRQVDDANAHCEALQKARQEAEEELQVGVLSCNVLDGFSFQQQAS